MDDLDLARIAYHAYGNASDFRTPNGDPMPKWDALSEFHRQAWVKTVRAIQAAAVLPSYAPVEETVLPFDDNHIRDVVLDTIAELGELSHQ